jgi:uncharacterized protein YjiS (DUF1127 family)
METTIHITEVKMTNTLTLTQSIFVKAYNSIQIFMTKLSERKATVRLVYNTVKPLIVLTDRELRDIGLSRYDIELVAKEYMNELNSK